MRLEITIGGIKLIDFGKDEQSAPSTGCAAVPLLVLTAAEIKDLAQFAGFRLVEESAPGDPDEMETEYVITAGHKDGVEGDSGSREHYKHVAYLEEYPEEGVFPLGPKLPCNNQAETRREEPKL